MYAFIGAMGGGKTTNAMMMGENFERNGYVVAYIISTKNRDTATHGTAPRFMHNRKRTYCIQATFEVSLLAEIDADLPNYDVLIIDEGWLFDDLTAWCRRCVWSLNKIVVVASITTSFDGVPMPNIPELLCYAHHVTNVMAVCDGCRETDALCNHRVTQELELNVFDQSKYQSLCVACYIDAMGDRLSQLMVS